MLLLVSSEIVIACKVKMLDAGPNNGNILYYPASRDRYPVSAANTK
jgi:hypothetical protein